LSPFRFHLLERNLEFWISRKQIPHHAIHHAQQQKIHAATNIHNHNHNNNLKQQSTIDNIPIALVKTAMGAVAGGVAGLILFKGGKGTRAASVATGIGAGIGSTWERVKFRYEQSVNK
jgi:uncharacterized protein YcfJ